MFQANQQIGVYTLVKRIGDGVFGEVWLGKIRNTPAQVAIRLPNLEPNRSGAIPYPKVYVEWKSFEALHQEAKLWAKASGHKNILQIIEVGVYGGQIIIVGEPSEFDSLADKLQTPDKFSIEQAIKLTIEILNGLEHLHELGLIHRNLTPHTIFLQNETPLLANFNITIATRADGFNYLAPETIANDRTCSVQTDIWSVGVILYQLLSGKLPFLQEVLRERILAIFSSEFSPLPKETPVWLKEIVGRALAKKPESRYQSAEEMRKDLEKALLEIQNHSAQPTQKFLRPSYPELMYSGALVVHGIRSHGATGGSVWEVAVAFDSQETVVAFYEKKFGKGQAKSDDGAIEWEWEDNIDSLKGYKTVLVCPESFIPVFSQARPSIQIPANTKTVIFIESSHW